jgi:hypothetical protein
MGSGAKSYMRNPSNIWGNAQIFSPYMSGSLVIYDFAPDPSEFPNIWGKFYFLFYQCRHGDFNDKDFCFSAVISTDNTLRWLLICIFELKMFFIICATISLEKFHFYEHIRENRPIISNCRRSRKIFLANHVKFRFNEKCSKKYRVPNLYLQKTFKTPWKDFIKYPVWFTYWWHTLPFFFQTWGKSTFSYFRERFPENFRVFHIFSQVLCAK